MSVLEFVLRLGAALVCGALIGVERQLHQHEAGLRTTALVATGSALFVLVAGLSPTNADPLRIAPQIVTGVGFLCAGVILRDGLHVRGLTTAGTLWCACSIGVLAGAGYYLPAFAGMGMVLAANLLLRPVDAIINRHAVGPAETPTHYVLQVTCRSQQERLVRSILLQELTGGVLALQSLHSGKDPQEPTLVVVTAQLEGEGHQDQLVEQVVTRLSLEEGISTVHWEIAQDDESGRPTSLTPVSGADPKRSGAP